MEGDIILMSEIFHFVREGISKDGKVVGQFRATGIVPNFQQPLHRRGIELDVALFNPDFQQ